MSLALELAVRYDALPCVDSWLEDTHNERGYVMGPTKLWHLALGWYARRPDRGCVRRDPRSASAYFAEVWLRGPSWGLPG